jgi:hypothetical protein
MEVVANGGHTLTNIPITDTGPSDDDNEDDDPLVVDIIIGITERDNPAAVVLAAGGEEKATRKSHRALVVPVTLNTRLDLCRGILKNLM